MRTAQVIALLLLGTLAVAAAQDVSVVLAKYPQYSKFNELLKTTGVLTEVNTRNSMTLLLPEDGALNAFLASKPGATTQVVADVIRYHCLLQYFGGEELANLAAGGVIVTTLYQSTGRANDLDGFVNITATPDGARTVGPSTPGSPVQANILTNVTQYPYNYSFLAISGVLSPLGLAAAQLAPTTPPTISPAPAPAGPVKAPDAAPVTAPVEAPAPVSDVPVVAPAPVSDVPVKAPAPVADVPVEAPAPVADVPVEAPAPVADVPVKAPAPVADVPVVAPSADVPTALSPQVADEPSADAPRSPIDSGAFAVSFNVVALAASGFVAAFML